MISKVHSLLWLGCFLVFWNVERVWWINLRFVWIKRSRREGREEIFISTSSFICLFTLQTIALFCFLFLHFPWIHALSNGWAMCLIVLFDGRFWGWFCKFNKFVNIMCCFIFVILLLCSVNELALYLPI